MSVHLVKIEEKTGDQAGTSSISVIFQSRWANIYEDSFLNNPVLRAEWVARSLPPAKLQAYARADTFDVCDIANRAAILVSGAGWE